MNTINALLKTRFSTRSFQRQPIPEPVLEAILEAGRLSPSGGNEQPWRFGVITDPDRIGKITQIAHRQAWLAQAPLLVVLCTVFVADDRGGRDIQRQRFPDQAEAITGMDTALYRALNQEEHQTKIAGTHMVLAAWEQGVGACWASRFEVQPLADLLNLPANMLPSEILAFGYPERQQKPVPKKNLDDLVFYNVWRNR